MAVNLFLLAVLTSSTWALCKPNLSRVCLRWAIATFWLSYFAGLLRLMGYAWGWVK